MKMGPENSGRKTKGNSYKKVLPFLLVLAMFSSPVTLAFVWNSTAREWRTKDRISKSPEFQETDTRVVVMSGRDALLPCKVTNLNDKVVSWIRTKDLHILTSGPVTFTADERFEGGHAKGSVDWSLRLRKAQVSDSGVYDCQINTDPKINRKVTLDVVSDFDDSGNPPSNDLYMVDDEGVPPQRGGVTRVLGEEEQFVKSGSTITFTCVVIIPGESVSSVEWFKDGRLISFQASRGGIIVETEKTEKKATSRLTVADVTSHDSGNYTCKPSNAKSHSVALVVVEGEHMEAMQRHTNGSQRLCIRRTYLFYTFCLVITLVQRHS